LPRLPPGLRRQALRNRSNPYAAFTTKDLVVAGAFAFIGGALYALLRHLDRHASGRRMI